MSLSDGADAAANATGVPDAAAPEVTSKKVWTTLITNLTYLPGLLTLHYSLQRANSQYPLIALYTDAFPAEGHRALDIRGIRKQKVKYLLPTLKKDYSNDPRFYDCWSKLTPFGLTEFERVVQLDSDMLCLKNMDELMEMELDGPEEKGEGQRVFAASHACVCNPLKKPHYPKEWVPANCAFTTQHSNSDKAQAEGAPPTAGLAMPNGGLQVVNPSTAVYDKIVAALADPKTMKYEFADQSLLSDVFPGRWVALPYIYNALKTLRWKGIHDAIWQDDKVKNIHYLLNPKPWSVPPAERDKEGVEESMKWWWQINDERLKSEKPKGIDDGF